MDSINSEIETLAEDIKQVRAEIPHVGSLLDAFGPLLLEKSRWLEEIKTYKKTFPVDPIQYVGGVPLIQQCQLFVQEDLWNSAGLSITKAIGQGFPHLAEDMADLSKQIADGRFDCFSLIHPATESDDDQLLAAQALDHGVTVISLQLLQRFSARFMLTKRAQDMAPELVPALLEKRVLSGMREFSSTGHHPG